MRDNNTTILKTIEYIEANLKNNIRLDDIAKEVGYSKYHLNRIFAESTGQTIHKYIQGRHLSESARKLISSDMHIVDIAQDSGYTSQQSFTLAFRQFYQCTPQVYRVFHQSNINRNKMNMSKNVRNIGKVTIPFVCRGRLAA